MNNSRQLVVSNINDKLSNHKNRLSQINIEYGIIKNPDAAQKSLPKKAKFKATPIQRIRKRYDPLYTWNKGGRVKELRIRCLARKYFIIWKRKTVGSLSNYEILKWRRLSILKRCWKIWREMHWELRIEPRLHGRAILHWRAVVIQKMFWNWRLWVRERMLARVREILGQKLFREKILKKTFICWREGVNEEKKRKMLVYFSENWSRIKVMKRYLGLWKEALESLQEIRVKIIIADNHFRHIYLRDHFLAWIRARPAIVASQKSWKLAVTQDYNTKLKTAFQNWIIFIRGQKVKHRLKERAINFYECCSMKRYLNIWKQQLISSLQLVSHQLKLTQLANKTCLRRNFIRWKLYIEYRKQKKDIVIKTIEYYHGNLQKRIFYHWSVIFIGYKRTNQNLKNLANQFLNKHRLKMAFNWWLKMSEEVEDRKLISKYGAARAHYRRHLLQSLLKDWIVYCDESRQCKKKTELAQKHSDACLLRKCVREWKRVTTLCRTKQKTLEIKNKIEKKMQSNVLLKWLNRTNTRLQTRDYMILWQQNQGRKLIMRSVLRNWQQKLSRVQLLKEAENKGKQCLLKRILNAWKIYCDRKNFILSKSDKLLKYHDSVCIQRTLAIWKMRLKQQETVTIMQQMKQEDLKRKFWRHWWFYVCEQRMKWEISERADRARRLNHAWLGWCSIIKKKRDIKIISVTISGRSEQALKRRSLYAWKRLFEQKHMANRFNRRICILNAWKTWKEFLRTVEISRKEKIELQQKAEQFGERRLMIQFWIKWRMSLNERQRELYYTQFSLAHWARNLESTVFVAWKNWSVVKKEKKRADEWANQKFENRAKLYAINHIVNCVPKKQKQFVDVCYSEKDKLDNDRTDCHGNKNESFEVCRSKQNELHNNKNIQKISTVTSIITKRSEPRIPSFLLDQNSTNHLDDSQIKIIKDSDEVLMKPNDFEERKEVSEMDSLEKLEKLRDELKIIKEKQVLIEKLQKELNELNECIEKNYQMKSKQVSDWTNAEELSFYDYFKPEIYRDQLISRLQLIKSSLEQDKQKCLSLANLTT